MSGSESKKPYWQLWNSFHVKLGRMGQMCGLRIGNKLRQYNSDSTRGGTVTHGYAIGIGRLPPSRNTARSEYVFTVAQLISRSQITLISRVIYIGKSLLAHTFPWCHSARTGLSGWMCNMVVWRWYLCINSEVNGSMLSGCILVCHSMTYLSVILFHITTTQHYMNPITELFVFWCCTHTFTACCHTRTLWQ